MSQEEFRGKLPQEVHREDAIKGAAIKKTLRIGDDDGPHLDRRHHLLPLAFELEPFEDLKEVGDLRVASASLRQVS